jgi:hypothetical protein
MVAWSFWWSWVGGQECARGGVGMWRAVERKREVRTVFCFFFTCTHTVAP